jgi:hypothetical protein
MVLPCAGISNHAARLRLRTTGGKKRTLLPPPLHALPGRTIGRKSTPAVPHLGTERTVTMLRNEQNPILGGDDIGAASEVPHEDVALPLSESRVTNG